MNEATLVANGLFRKGLRTTLLIIATVVAFFIFGMLAAVDRVFQSGVDAADADRIITVNRINFTVSMPYAHVNRIRAIEGIEAATFASWFGGYYREPRNFFQTFAIDPETYLDVYPDQVVLTPEQRERFLGDRRAIAIGRALAEQFEIEEGDTIPLQSNIWTNRDGSSTYQVNVAAVFDGENDRVPTNYAVINYEYFDESRAFGNDQVGWIVSRTVDPARNQEIMDAIDAQFANSAFETETSTEAAFSAAFAEQLGDIRLIVTSVVGAAFATILMIVGTTMALSVRERTKEIAVMKSLGFPSARIIRLVLSESVLICVLGAAIGLGLAWIALAQLGPGLATQLPGLGLPPQLWGIGLGVAAALGLVTGAAPAVGAMRVNTAIALSKD